MNSILKKSLGFILVLFLMVFSLSTVVKVKATSYSDVLNVGTNGGCTWSNGVRTESATVGNVTFTALTSGGNDGKYYTADNSWRFYTADTSGIRISIPNNYKIDSIIIQWKTTAPVTPAHFTQTGSNNTYTYTVNDSSILNTVDFVRGSGNVLFQIITVNYSTYGEQQNVNLTSISLTNVALKPGQTGRTTVTFDPANATDKTVTYAITAGSEYAEVANDGTITAKAAGVATLTVTPNDTNASAQTCSINVTDYPAPALTVGNTYYLYGKNGNSTYELKTIEKVNSNNVGTMQEYAEYPSLYPLLVEDGLYTNTVAFKNGNNYLSYTSGSTLETKGTVDAESSWLVSIENNNFVVKNVKTQNMQIMFNYSSSRFACYAGTQKEIYFYDPTQINVSISTTGTKLYLDSTLTFNLSTNAQNPVVTWNSSNTNAATIDSNGVLHPVGIGKTTVKATINDVDSNEVEITVFPNPANPITTVQANAIAEVAGTTKTTELFKIDGSISYVDGNSLTITDQYGSIVVYKYGHGFDSAVDGKEVRVTGKIYKFQNTTNEITDGTITFYHAVTFDSNGGSAVASQKVLDGAKATRPTPDPTKDGFTFNGWKNGNEDWDFNTNTVTSDITLTAQWATPTAGLVINLLNSTQAYMSLAYKYSRNYGTSTDTLTRELTGISGSGYGDWSNKRSVTDTAYSGNSSGSNDSISLRSGSGSGIIAKSSGYARKVTISFNSNTADGRTIDIYGSDTEYASPSDLYNNSLQGTKLGSIVYGTSTELTIDGSYRYIGIRSSGNTIYIDSIEIDWYGLYQYEDSDFRLRCGFDNSSFATDLAAISGEATYGIEVSTTSKTERFAQNNELIKTSGDMKYVLVDLGDALTKSDRLDIEFTVKVYVELDEDIYYATNDAMIKTYSVASMIETYYQNEEVKPLILNLYNLLVAMGKIE